MRNILGFILLAGLAPLPAQDSVVMRAMRDELGRSMKQLQLAKLEKPYFLSYRVTETETHRAAATFGALIASTGSRRRSLGVELRVGDYKLDNTNFLSLSSGGAGVMQMYGGVALLPPLHQAPRSFSRPGCAPAGSRMAARSRSTSYTAGTP